MQTAHDTPAVDPLHRFAMAAASGSDAAVRELVRATQARLLRTATRILRDADAAEDVVLTAYTRAVVAMRAGKFRFDAPVASWLDRIVTLGALDALRARRRDLAGKPIEDADEAFHDGAPSPEEVAAARADMRRAELVLAELPPRQREAIVLTEVEGLSASEAADAMRCTLGALELLLVRARRTLRARLRDEAA